VYDFQGEPFPGPDVQAAFVRQHLPLAVFHEVQTKIGFQGIVTGDI
jgi:hypothetical protein